MYRVAVIQNESEMQRTGYANVIAKLRTIERFKDDYFFELYTVVNLSDLFEKGYNQLCQYDSLIITTNATSDKIVYKILKENKEEIEKFIKKSKGIFIASQKKLGKQETPTDFLPENYDFHTRPRPEDSSGEGNISIFEKNKNNILLCYPNKIEATAINERCEKNPFMKHFYRSCIQPVDKITYTPILVDNKNCKSEIERNLVMTNAFSKQKIVVSTIALDWEYHKELLTNIITFITEGLPQIAFVDKNNNNSIKCLIESAKILKKAHSIYNSLNDIKELQKNIHSIYILSADYTENEINDFLNTIDNNSDFIKKRVYQVKEENEILKLFRHSKYSSIDKIIRNSVSWLESQHPIGKGMWNDGFWTTFEILSFFDKLGMKEELNGYITPVLNDIKEHYNDQKHSYDGVVSATCGLVKFLLLLNEKQYQQSILTDSDLEGMIKWMTDDERFKAQSPFDKRNIVLTLSLIKDLNSYSITQEKYSEMITDASQDKIGSAEYSEIEICQIISIYLLNQETNESEIKSLLKSIKDSQTFGAWNNNVGRTSNVLIFLLQNFDDLKKYIRENDLEDMIYRGILFLRSKYNNKNWGDKDIQATAKAAHAIFLNNERNHASMYDYDVLKIIEEENSEIIFSEIIKDLTDNLREYRGSYNKLKGEKENLQNEKEALQSEFETYKHKINKEVSSWFWVSIIAIIVIAVLITFIFYKLHNNIFHSIIAGFITSVILLGVELCMQYRTKIKSFLNKIKRK